MKKLIIFLLVTFCLVGLVQAMVIPHAFYGTAKHEGGNNVVNGATVTAKLNGEEVDSCTVSNGKYGYGDDTLIITNDGGQDGTITFFVDGVEANENNDFESGGITELDLTVEGEGVASFCGDGTCDADENCSSCPDDCGVCPPPDDPLPDDPPSEDPPTGSSGTGPSGGGGTSRSKTQVDEAPVEETIPEEETKMDLSPMEEDSGAESVDTPITVQGQQPITENVVVEEEEEGFGNMITGAVIGFAGDNRDSLVGILVIFGVIVLGVLGVYINYKMKKTY